MGIHLSATAGAWQSIGRNNSHRAVARRTTGGARRFRPPTGQSERTRLTVGGLGVGSSSPIRLATSRDAAAQPLACPEETRFRRQWGCPFKGHESSEYQSQEENDSEAGNDGHNADGKANTCADSVIQSSPARSPVSGDTLPCRAMRCDARHSAGTASQPHEQSLGLGYREADLAFSRWALNFLTLPMCATARILPAHMAQST